MNRDEVLEFLNKKHTYIDVLEFYLVKYKSKSVEDVRELLVVLSAFPNLLEYCLDYAKYTLTKDFDIIV